MSAFAALLLRVGVLSTIAAVVVALVMMRERRRDADALPADEAPRERP